MSQRAGNACCKQRSCCRAAAGRAPFASAGVIVWSKRGNKNGSQARRRSDRRQRLCRPAAGGRRRFRRGELQRAGRGRRRKRAGGVARIATRDRSTDRSERRTHLQVAGRRPAGRVLQPGRRPRARRWRCRTRAAKFAPERGLRLRLRCAIHMGQVTVEGTDLLGDGINVVSRLQQHAPAGGVLVSAAVMDLIGGLIDAPVKDLGTLKLRNISRPVHAYAVGAGKRPRATPAIDSFQRRRPSIAVLPFIDQAAEAAASYFSDGLVEDIIAGLACLPELRRDLAQLDAALSRHHARSATGPPRPARALHALGHRSARARPHGRHGEPVGRTHGLRNRREDLERPLRRRGGRYVRLAGRLVGCAWWRRSPRRCRNRNCAACCASGRRASMPMNACCAGST